MMGVDIPEHVHDLEPGTAVLQLYSRPSGGLELRWPGRDYLARFRQRESVMVRWKLLFGSALKVKDSLRSLAAMFGNQNALDPAEDTTSDQAADGITHLFARRFPDASLELRAGLVVLLRARAPLTAAELNELQPIRESLVAYLREADLVREADLAPLRTLAKRPRTGGRLDGRSFDRAYQTEKMDLDEGTVGLMMRVCERTYHPVLNRLTDALGLPPLRFYCDYRFHGDCCVLALDRDRSFHGLAFARKGSNKRDGGVATAVALDESFFVSADNERAALAIALRLLDVKAVPASVMTDRVNSGRALADDAPMVRREMRRRSRSHRHATAQEGAVAPPQWLHLMTLATGEDVGEEASGFGGGESDTGGEEGDSDSEGDGGDGLVGSGTEEEDEEDDDDDEEEDDDDEDEEEEDEDEDEEPL